MQQKQLELVFFPMGKEPPSAEARRRHLDPTNPASPYFGFIGNESAVNKLIRIDFTALGRYNHACNDLSVAFLGQAGCGKSELARRHAKANRLPLVEISPKSVKTVHSIFNIISRVCEEWKLPLIEMERENNYILPPMNIFIDEVHALSDGIVQGLLKATEFNDGILVTEKDTTIDCSSVHWMIATTDRGKLFDAFDTRFTKCTLNMYSKAEIAQIVQVHNPEWEMEVCRLVAHFCGRSPREATAFAREMNLEYEMNPRPWLDVAHKVAEDNEIDKFGMTYRRVAILKALGQGPISEKRLVAMSGVKAEELEKFVMPWLLASTDEMESLVIVSNKGYTITEAGLRELDIRNIPHKGKYALAA